MHSSQHKLHNKRVDQFVEQPHKPRATILTNLLLLNHSKETINKTLTSIPTLQSIASMLSACCSLYSLCYD